MASDVLDHVPEEDRWLVEADAAEVLAQTLDLRPIEGWDDEDAYDREERR